MRWAFPLLLLMRLSVAAELTLPARPTNFPLSIPAINSYITGRVVVWPNQAYGPTNDLGNDNVKISSQSDGAHVLVLKSDGTVVAFGLNGEGQCNVPPGLRNVVDIAAGRNHSLALKSDGTVVQWGLVYGTGVPSNLSGVVAIAGGFTHSLALKSDGTVVGWGGLGSSVPAEATNVVKIYAGDNYSLAIKSDGSVIGWGTVTESRYGWGPIPSGISNAVDICGGMSRIYVLRADGQILTWGSGNDLSVISNPSNSVQIAGGSVLYSLRANHNVDVWASSAFTSDVPLNLGKVLQVSSGYNRVALVQDGVSLTVIADSGRGFVNNTPNQPIYLNGQSVSLNALPFPGYVFTNWTGARNDINNPIEITINGETTITANFVPDLNDSDSDGLSNYSEAITYNSNPNKFSTTEDSIGDGRKVQLGYSPLLNLNALISSLKTDPISGLYNQSQYDSNRSTGRNEILNSPNSYNLYSTSQILNLGLGGIVLNRNANNQLVLNYNILQSTDLQNWFPYQQNELIISNPPPDKMFLRVQAVGP